jgi:hypothetical protein
MLRITGVGLLALSLFTLPAFAETPQEPVTPRTAETAVPEVAEPTDTQCTNVPETLPTPKFLTEVCVATCTEGPDQICTGSSCTATDQACPGTQGFCFSPEEGFKVCGACQFPLPCSGGLCP